MSEPHALRDAFIEDHQKMTRGLSELIRLVEAGEMVLACRTARELDRVIGPHIEFEEKRFYPQVRKSRGEHYVDALYDEHRAGVEAIRALEEGPDGIDEANRSRILEKLRVALDHAVSCGTLLSYVTSLPEDEQKALLEDLERFRREGNLWTKLEKTVTEAS